MVDNLGKPPANTTATIPVKSTKNKDSERDAHKVSLFIINGCIFLYYDLLPCIFTIQSILIYSLFHIINLHRR